VANIQPIREFFSDNGPLAEVVGSGYCRRDEQVRMAEAVEEALEDGDLLLAHAPTGTGKSFAYLAPALLSSKKLVVSTATKALQRQLVEKDLPIVASAMRGAGLEPPRYALLKGRSDFLCDRRFEEYADHASLQDLEVMDDIEAWRAQTLTGDKEELPFAAPRFWADVAADSEDCHGKSCPFAGGCHYFSHKDRGVSADVIVVNHALLLANLASGEAVFPMAGRHIVLDEAHRIEDYAAEALGCRVSKHRINYVLRAIERKVTDLGKFTARARECAESFFEELKSFRDLGNDKTAPPSYGPLLRALVALSELVADNPREEVNALQGMILKLMGDLKGFYQSLEDTHAYAIQEATFRSGPPVLASWLVDPSFAFGRLVCDREDEAGIVLTSATLAIGGRLDYQRSRLGVNRLPVTAHEHKGCEIFDYANNCLVYLAEDLAQPTQQNADVFVEQSLYRTAELVGASGGRALVLLSSHKALRRFKEGFSELVGPHPVRFQGDAGTGQLIEWLKSTSGAVLVATRSFWEGVDIPGEAVSLVVVDKVPFAPPNDPLVAKRLELCERDGGNGFMDVSLPQALMAIQQGLGRLIRTHTDRGVIAILDSRVTSRPWGRMVHDVLPDAAPLTTSVGDVGLFFAEKGAA
jgi:ATP-dependent DNA helicase DinG